jgi:hypothetical protein
MSEKLIVSKEIESIIDKDNIFGFNPSGEIPLSLWFSGAIIYTEIISANISSGRIKLEFKTRSKLAQALLTCRKINKILIGDEDSDHFISFEKCDLKSISVSSEEDMYLCRIVATTT